MNTDDSRIQIALAALLLRGPVVDLFQVLGINAEPFVTPVSLLLFVIGLVSLIKKHGKFILVSSVIFGLLWLISARLHPATVPYIKVEGMQFFVYSLPFLWFGHYFISNRIYLDMFLPIARIKLILALIVQVFVLFGLSGDIFKGDYQTAANSIIVGLIATSYLAVQGRKPLDIFLTIIGTIILISVGSRSSLVALVFFWTVYWVSISRSAKIKVAIAFVAALFLIIGIDPLLKAAAFLGRAAGFSMHLADALSSGNLFVDEQREMLYTGFSALIAKSPWGYGILGDRYISYETGLYWKPMYPHNIYLEVLVNFGYIIGTIIVLWFTYYLIKSLFVCRDKSYRVSILLLASVSFIKLLFSSSYWIDQMFFMLLGAILAYPKLLVSSGEATGVEK